MKFNNKLSIVAILILTLSLLGCGSEMAGTYIGTNETETDEIRLMLNSDNTFLMELYANGDYTGAPQETLSGTWKRESDQLKLTSSDDNIITYELTLESYTVAGALFDEGTYRFKASEKKFFGSDFDLTKDYNAGK